MIAKLFLVICAFLACQVGSEQISPRDLADEAHEQIVNLRNTVESQIVIAHDNLDSNLEQLQVDNDNDVKQAAIDIQQEHETVVGRITTLKDLAESAGVDATVCINIREQVIDRLPTEYTDTLVSCVDRVNLEAAQIIRDAVYIVDVIITKVNDLEFQLNQCRGQLTCITTLVTEIELNSISLPQKIQTEVNSAESLLDTLYLSTQQCSSIGVASFTSEANSILGDIEACINRLLP